jgi:alkylresorcinol/alkylpyrone synthase
LSAIPASAARPAPHRSARTPAAVAGLGAAFPATRGQREIWDGFFAEHYEHRKKARAVWLRCGVEQRHGVADPFVEDVRYWSTEQRMRRFLQDALPLSVEAATAALDDAGLSPSDLGQITVVTCTGYGTPGLDIRLAEALGCDAATQRTHIGHMGCYAAIPGLAQVSDAAVARDRAGLLVCIELTSLHIQPPSDDSEQLVAHALFSDAAAAAVVTPDGPGLEVLDIAALTDTSTAGYMTWDVTDLGFKMGLSTKVPEVLDRHVERLTDDLLAGHGLRRADVAAWAVHPGGPRIVDVVADRLGLPQDELDPSRATLAEHGNCSSATVLLVLDRIRAERDLRAGDHVVAMAFGPGLTLYAALLRAT